MDILVHGQLVGSEIHGFRTMEDLDMVNVLGEAKARWLRPNEIHAILCNHKHFNIHVRPVILPISGTIVLFDRKMLRNFRKDGHNWKKKKDGKTVKEAHEHLKVGDEERIHVYYAHGEDNSTFVRRCYWLLDKKLEHIVLVHYRETQEVQFSPVTPLNFISGSPLSDPSVSVLMSEEYDSSVDQAYSVGKKYSESNDNLTLENHEMRLHEINTLEWEELLVPEQNVGQQTSFEKQNQYQSCDNRKSTSVNSCVTMETLLGKFSKEGLNVLDSDCSETMGDQLNVNLQRRDSVFPIVGTGDVLGSPVNGGLQTQDSFGRWINDIISGSPGSIDDHNQESSASTGHESLSSAIIDQYQPYASEKTFSITDVSPGWAFSTEETKILIIGYFRDGHSQYAESSFFCKVGDVCVPAEVVQPGVLRCFLPPHSPGLTNLHVSTDGQNCISQIVKFEFRSSVVDSQVVSVENNSSWEEFRIQMRLAHLLFSTSNILHIFSGRVSQNSVKEAKTFSEKTLNIGKSWVPFMKSMEIQKHSLPKAKDYLFKLALQNRLREWLLENMIEGKKKTDCDEQGQGVIHLCAILGYSWVIYPFSLSGLSLDYRDKFGWTALHWAAYYGREKMVAALLSAGAKPNLVTDPTPENPGGCTAADLASKNEFDGLAAYLAEKGLVQQFTEMHIAGNVRGSLPTCSSDSVNLENVSKDEIYLKDSLEAYRTAADAAARIQAAFREHSFKLLSKEVQFSSPEDEARNIIAAMRIQHAFRNYETRKKMTAAAHIQHRFRSWKIRKQFLFMRRQAIKIQATFRGYQVRKQYHKIVWSVGVLEKAILRWRLKRKGFRGLQVQPGQALDVQSQESIVEEDFFKAGRKQAEERTVGAVVKVQALFRSKQAQEQYQRMKMEHYKAQLEYEEAFNPDVEMA